MPGCAAWELSVRISRDEKKCQILMQHPSLFVITPGRDHDLLEETVTSLNFTVVVTEL
jgi:hypothetical protein